MITTPFFVNNYVHHNGKTETVHNPVKTRRSSEIAVALSLRLNCRLRVTRLAGYADEKDFGWPATALHR